MLFKPVRLCYLAALGARFSLGAVQFQSPDQLPEIEYDFIIAGGGTAGGVVAARLAENSKYNVLLIEAGPSNEDIFETHPPGLTHELITQPGVDWNYSTIPQAGVNNRISTYPRGKMLGGCSSHNGMVFTRGSRDDWDSWAQITGEQELSWDRMQPSTFFKTEKYTIDSEHQNENGHIDLSVHGRQGKVSVSAGYSIHPFNDKLIQTTKELTSEFPFAPDMNNGKPIGIAWNQFTIDGHAERSSSATAYVETSGKNVHVLLNTFVTRVLPVGNGTDFRGVEFAVDTGSPRKQLVAKKEVIISGGIFGTPQILLNSGIGKREELEALGIKTLVDNPSVGKNLSDQVSSILTFGSTLPVTDYDRDTALAEWNKSRTGPMALPGHLNHIAWLRLPDDAAPFKDGFSDPTSGPNSPHIEYYFSQISSNPPSITGVLPPIPPDAPNVTVQLTAVNLHPVSRGSVRLRSSDPFDLPDIDLGLLSDDLDIAILREALRSIRRMFSAPTWSGSVGDSVIPGANITTDADLDVYIRNVASPYLHGVGSASMSPREADWGVVDTDFLVKGTSGLRVVDASVIPSVPSGHTQASVYGFAELASEKISKAWE